MFSSLTNFGITFLKRHRDVSGQKSVTSSGLEQAILDELGKHASLRLMELIKYSGRSRSTVGNKVKKLVEEGKIEPLEPAKSPKQRYRKVH